VQALFIGVYVGHEFSPPRDSVVERVNHAPMPSALVRYPHVGAWESKGIHTVDLRDRHGMRHNCPYVAAGCRATQPTVAHAVSSSTALMSSPEHPAHTELSPCAFQCWPPSAVCKITAGVSKLITQPVSKS
jgi:hypothetical protein